MSSPATRPTHEDGITAAQQIADEFGITWAEMRRIAADHLAEDWPADEGMGSSDISGHLGVLANYEPTFLREQAAQVAAVTAERNALVNRIAGQTGRSFDETLTGLQMLFAPARPRS